MTCGLGIKVVYNEHLSGNHRCIQWNVCYKGLSPFREIFYMLRNICPWFSWWNSHLPTLCPSRVIKENPEIVDTRNARLTVPGCTENPNHMDRFQVQWDYIPVHAPAPVQAGNRSTVSPDIWVNTQLRFIIPSSGAWLSTFWKLMHCNPFCSVGFIVKNRWHN